MIWQDAELHNVVELVDAEGCDGTVPSRIPNELRGKVNDAARRGALSAAGCELRFNLEGARAEPTPQALMPDFAAAASPPAGLVGRIGANCYGDPLLGTLSGASISTPVLPIRRGQIQAFNRLVLGLLTAALFVGSTSLLSSNVKPLFYETSIPGAAGCIVAVYFGFTLIRAIKKSGDIQ